MDEVEGIRSDRMGSVSSIIGGIVVMILIILTAVFFGIPGWVPGHKPDKETMGIIAVLIGIILLIAVAALQWNAMMT